MKFMRPLKLKQSAPARFAPLDPQSFTFDEYTLKYAGDALVLDEDF